MSEHLTQKAFFEWAEYQHFPGIELMHAVPNGGQRSKATAGKLKAEGVKAGVLDVLWPVARGAFIGLAIEFKEGDGVPSREQRKRIDDMQIEGWCVAVCWTWEAAARTVSGYAGLLRVSMAAP